MACSRKASQLIGTLYDISDQREVSISARHLKFLGEW
jgi:hypothetical protein